MQHFLHNKDLYDMWRCFHSSKRDFTCFSTAYNSYSRIDYFLVDKWLLQHISDYNIDPITWSDDASICLTVNFTRPHMTAKLWRANTYVLKSSLYANMLQQQLDDFFMHNAGSVDNPATLWVAHKAFMGRGALIKMGSIQKRRKMLRIDEILSQIESTESLNNS